MAMTKFLSLHLHIHNMSLAPSLVLITGYFLSEGDNDIGKLLGLKLIIIGILN